MAGVASLLPPMSQKGPVRTREVARADPGARASSARPDIAIQSEPRRDRYWLLITSGLLPALVPSDEESGVDPRDFVPRTPLNDPAVAVSARHHLRQDARHRVDRKLRGL